MRVRVPATSANVGPGFDSLGLALDLYDEIEVTTTNSGLSLQIRGEGADTVPRGPEHLVVRALERGLKASGVRVSGLSILCRNEIPHARGLGSSAAAVVAGLAAGRRLVHSAGLGTVLSDDQLIQLAAEFEGHPDNAAAAVLGGVVIAYTVFEIGDAGPNHHAVRVQPHPDIQATVLIPADRSRTADTRDLLPSMVPHRDAAFNVSRTALAVVALTRRPDLLLPATADLLHQPYRAQALPVTTAWIGRLRAAGIAAMVSGAGPTVLALHTRPISAQLQEEAHSSGLRVLATGLTGRCSACAANS